MEAAISLLQRRLDGLFRNEADWLGTIAGLQSQVVEAQRLLSVDREEMEIIKNAIRKLEGA